MIHEAMILKAHLALIEWAASLKFMIFPSPLANLFVPWGVATDIAPVAFTVAVIALPALLSLLIAIIETRVAKPLFRVARCSASHSCWRCWRSRRRSC